MFTRRRFFQALAATALAAGGAAKMPIGFPTTNLQFLQPKREIIWHAFGGDLPIPPMLTGSIGRWEGLTFYDSLEDAIAGGPGSDRSSPAAADDVAV